MHVIGQVERERAAIGRGRYSLFTGDIGVALFLRHLLDGERPLPDDGPVRVSDPRARSFGAAAADYERGRPGWPERVAEVAGLPPGAEVLDLAAGTGKLTRLLVRHFRSVTAVEPDDALRALIRDAETLAEQRKRSRFPTPRSTASSAPRRSTGSTRRAPSRRLRASCGRPAPSSSASTPTGARPSRAGPMRRAR